MSKQLSLCHYLVTICHPFVSNLFSGEMFSTCARSLAAMSGDLAHACTEREEVREYSVQENMSLQSVIGKIQLTK